METPPEESGATELDDDASDAEKIEVHVHLHRTQKRSRSGSVRPTMTGVLFDWQWYQDQLSKRPRPKALGRWSLTKRCQACDADLPPSARVCPRCAAPRSRKRLIPAVLALVGLGSIVAAFALSFHILGDSTPEHRAPAPLGQWTDDDVVIVEVPATPSPFSATATEPAAGSGPSASEAQTR